MEDAKLDAISLALKYLLCPLPNDISQLWERCCDLTLVGRSMSRRRFPVFCAPTSKRSSENIFLTDALRVRIMTTGELPIPFEANTLVVPADLSQAGFDSLIFGYHGVDNQKQAFIYNEMKIGPPKEGNLSKIVAAKLVSVVDYHFNKAMFAKDHMEDECLSSIFFNLYIYSSVVIGDTFNEDLKSQLNIVKEDNNQGLDSTIEVGEKETLPETTKSISNDISKKLKKRKELLRNQETIERTMRYVQLFGNDHINILNRQSMDQWLLPSVIPIATLVQAVEEGTMVGY